MRLRGALVIAQIALTMVLLVCAGLVWKSFAAITRVNPGIQIENTLSMVLTLSPTRYDTGPKRTDYYRQVLERISAVPGVESVAFTQTMPFTWGIPATFSVYGVPDDTAKLPPAYYDSISPSYFATMHIPLLAGRTFAETDDAGAERDRAQSIGRAKILSHRRSDRQAADSSAESAATEPDAARSDRRGR